MIDKIKARPLRPYEKKQLQRMKRQRTNAVNCRHARIVLLSRGGWHNRDIAGEVDCSPQWVRVILHRFNSDGIYGVSWYPFFHTRGTPRRFLSDVREQIAEVALSPPTTLIGMQQWSLSKLRDYLVQQRIVSSISVEWLRQLLRRFKVRLRRTKTWKESSDPQFWPKYRALRRLYQQRPPHGRRLCVDEFGPLYLQPRHGHCYACKGRRHVQRIPANYDRHKGTRHFLAFYDLETDRLYGQFTTCKTAVQWLAFLKWVRRRYPSTQELHMVMDNYPTHLTVDIIGWTWAHNVKLYQTPTNASWLNRIECHFTALKAFAMKPSNFQSHDEQQQAIESYLLWYNRRRTIACESWKDYKACKEHNYQRRQRAG
jgi:transposase